MVYIYSVLCCLFLFPYLGWRGGQALGARARHLFWGLLATIFVLFFVGLATHRLFQADWMSDVMNGMVYIFFSTLYVAAAVFLINGLRRLDARYWGCYGHLGLRGQRWLKQGLFAGLVLLFFGLMVVGHRNVRYPQVVHRRMVLSRLTPAGAEPRQRLRLVFFSDLHIGEAMTPDYVGRAVDLILAQRPDVILSGGDFIDHLSEYAYDPRVVKLMRRLHAGAPSGAYYVLGNHEYRADTMANIRYVAETGATLLRDSTAFIVGPQGDSLRLIGRDDAVNEERRPLEFFFSGTPGSLPTILMEHTPKSIDSLSLYPMDLMLCGHTHGGQIWPGQLLVWARVGMASGLRREGERELYISQGIGSAGATYRIGTRSEIVVYDLWW